METEIMPSSSIPRFKDAALGKAFPVALTDSVKTGARGIQVLAVQYGLGRLGYLHGSADSSFGPLTAAAVGAFQRSCSLPVTAEVDERVLAALDAALATYDARPPAARTADPLGYLLDFDARGLERIEITDRTTPVNWSHPEVEAAYERFVPAYWEVLKANIVEADCKTLAAFILDAFRTKLKRDTGLQLALPGTRAARLAPMHWQAATAAHPRDWLTRVDRVKTTVRPGYDVERAIEALDPAHSMIFGVNIRPQDIATCVVADSGELVCALVPTAAMRADKGAPEIPIAPVRAGMVLFFDHDGDGRFDHTVTVVEAQRDAGGAVRMLRLAVGSYDDIKDADHATVPHGVKEINSYAEEVVVQLDASGRIVSSETTWTSEPRWIQSPRYNAANSIKESHARGRIKVCRWRDPPG